MSERPPSRGDTCSPPRAQSCPSTAEIHFHSLLRSPRGRHLITDPSPRRRRAPARCGRGPRARRAFAVPKAARLFSAADETLRPAGPIDPRAANACALISHLVDYGFPGKERRRSSPKRSPPRRATAGNKHSAAPFNKPPVPPHLRNASRSLRNKGHDAISTRSPRILSAGRGIKGVRIIRMGHKSADRDRKRGPLSSARRKGSKRNTPTPRGAPFRFPFHRLEARSFDAANMLNLRVVLPVEYLEGNREKRQTLLNCPR